MNNCGRTHSQPSWRGLIAPGRAKPLPMQVSRSAAEAPWCVNMAAVGSTTDATWLSGLVLARQSTSHGPHVHRALYTARDPLLSENTSRSAVMSPSGSWRPRPVRGGLSSNIYQNSRRRPRLDSFGSSNAATPGLNAGNPGFHDDCFSSWRGLHPCPHFTHPIYDTLPPSMAPGGNITVIRLHAAQGSLSLPRSSCLPILGVCPGMDWRLTWTGR